MKPFETISPTTCQRLLGVVFDVDDTITDDGRLGPDAHAALWDLHRAGLRLAAVTGRPLGWADVLARLLPIDVAIGENGAGWVWRAPEGIRENTWEMPEERARQNDALGALVSRVRAELPDVRLASDQRARRCDVAFDVAEDARLPAAMIERLCSLIAAAGARVLVSSVHAHAFFGAWDKAQGVVRALGEATGQDVATAPDRWLFVGDSGNDAPAFAYFPESVGVANVASHIARLPVPPRWVTISARGKGFAEIARVILKARHNAARS